MAARNTVLGLSIVGLGAAVATLAYLVAPADLSSGEAEASSFAPDPGAPPSPAISGGNDPAAGAEESGGPRGTGRLAVAAAKAPAETGAFAADALYGRVVDPGGAGIAGARVELFLEIAGAEESGPSLGGRTTDAKGRFRFPGLEPFVPLRLYAAAEGYRPASSTWTCGRDEEIELQPARTIAGRVLDAETGEPLADVEVAIPVPWVEDGVPRDELRTRSDEAGRYRLGAIREEGQQSFVARRPGHQEERVSLQILPEQSEGYDIRLHSAPALTLEFYDLASGEPLPDTAVWIDRGGEHTTDHRGRLALSPLPDRRRRNWRPSVEAWIDGWCRTRAVLDPGDPTPPRVLRIPLCRGGVLAGRVTLGGAGIAKARVDYYLPRHDRRPPPVLAALQDRLPPGTSLRDGVRRTTTDATGAFTLAGIVPRDGLVALRVDHLRTLETRREDVTSPDVGETTEVEVELPRGSVVQGTVRLNGEPVAAELSWWGEGSGAQGASNDRGAYRLEGVPAGEVRISVRTEGNTWGGARDEPDVVWVEEDSVLEHDIERFSAKAVIAGRVRDAGGTPLAGLQVVAWSESPGGRSAGARAETDEDGRFEIAVEPLPGTPFVVYARDGARLARERNVAAGTTGLELVLPETGRLGLRVVDETTGEPLARFQLLWRRETTDAYEVLRGVGREVAPGPGGIFVAEFPLGPVDLLVLAPTQGYASVEVERCTVDRRDPPGVVDVALPRGTRVTLRFLPAEEGEAAQRPPRILRRGRIYLASPGEVPAEDAAPRGSFLNTMARRGRTIRAYRFTAVLEALEPGRYRFAGLGEELELEPPVIDVPAVPEATFEIRWRIPAR